MATRNSRVNHEIYLTQTLNLESLRLEKLSLKVALSNIKSLLSSFSRSTVVGPAVPFIAQEAVAVVRFCIFFLVLSSRPILQISGWVQEEIYVHLYLPVLMKYNWFLLLKTMAYYYRNLTKDIGTQYQMQFLEFCNIASSFCSISLFA